MICNRGQRTQKQLPPFQSWNWKEIKAPALNTISLNQRNLKVQFDVNNIRSNLFVKRERCFIKENTWLPNSTFYYYLCLSYLDPRFALEMDAPSPTIHSFIGQSPQTQCHCLCSNQNPTSANCNAQTWDHTIALVLPSSFPL